jgi:peptide/nickel transport system substrate-binding protein
MLSPGNPLYDSVRDTWKQRYPYDPARASSILDGAGWRKGADGVLADSAGERLTFPSWTTQGQERKIAIVADMWRQLGADIQEYVIPAARVRDAEFRQSYPAVEITARGNEDVLLTRLESLSTPTGQNHFAGNNRGHWKNETFDRLTNQYRASLREPERGALIKQLQDIMVDELPIGLLHYEVGTVLVRKGVTAFRDDVDGGASSGRIYGTYSRNAHLWDITS